MASKRVRRIVLFLREAMLVLAFLGALGFPIHKKVITIVEVATKAVEQVDQEINTPKEEFLDKEYEEEITSSVEEK